MSEKNYGLIIPKITTREEGAEHFLGSGKLKGQVINPSGDWTPYLPDREPQNKRGIETQACTNYATDNALETLQNFYGKPFNHSDRYFAIVSGTDPNRGNDPHKVAEALRKNSGALKEELMPFSDDITSAADYYQPNPPPEALRTQAQKWYDTWDFAHEWVFLQGTPEEKREKIKDALTKGTVCVSVSAWYFDSSRNLYYKPQGAQDNHWTQLVKAEANKYIVFDSYDSYLKDLDPLYNFEVAKIYYLSPAQPKLSILSKLLDLIGQILKIDALLIQKPPVLVNPPQELPLPQSLTIPTAHVSRIEPWANAIEKEEGFAPATRSFRNHNPGNLRYTPYTASLGASGHDLDNFCIFPTYDHGFRALCQFLIDAANNRLKAYKNCTLEQFTTIYAHPPINHPYAANVAKAIGVKVVNIPISQLL